MDLSMLQDHVWLLLTLSAAAYLMGSISSAILTCRALGYPDPRTQGSSNPGATNVLRIAGKPAAALTLLGDVLKGVIPVLVARQLELGNTGAALVGLAAFFGHLYPVFFEFRGGKGVATAFGLLFVLDWRLGLVTGAVWLLVFLLTRISSLAALLAFIAMPVAAWWLIPDALAPLVLLSAVLLLRHQSNIRKLLAREELGFRAPRDH